MVEIESHYMKVTEVGVTPTANAFPLESMDLFPKIGVSGKAVKEVVNVLGNDFESGSILADMERIAIDRRSSAVNVRVFTPNVYYDSCNFFGVLRPARLACGVAGVTGERNC
jgi:hypothetical protein